MALDAKLKENIVDALVMTLQGFTFDAEQLISRTLLARLLVGPKKSKQDLLAL